MRLSKVWLLTCLASQLVVFSAALPPRKLLQTSDVFPWFTGTTNSMPDKSGGQTGSSAFAPGPSKGSNGKGSGSGSNSTSGTSEEDTPEATCPRISLKLNSIEIYDSIINDPDKNLVVVCYNRAGQAFQPVVFNTTSDVVRSVSGARYRPSESVAQIVCGDSISCTVAYSEPSNPNMLTAIAEGGCWFDYRHFTQLSYEEPLSAWTCTKPPVRYTLECIECGNPDFPWEDALALAGPPLDEAAGLSDTPTLNSVMVIISVSIVAGAVILVVTALLLRGRRRSIEENIRVTELILARSREHANSQRRRRNSFKPPAVFVVGEPIDGPPPPGYTGPIVVLHCGDEQEEEDYYSGEFSKEAEEVDGGDRASGSGESEVGPASQKSMFKWPQIAIARPELVVKKDEEETPEEMAEAALGGELELSNINSEEMAAAASSTDAAEATTATAAGEQSNDNTRNP